MYITVATLLALQCTLCLAIKVPIVWTEETSEVNKNKFAFEQFDPQNVASSNQKTAPKEYFQYPAQKQKFAVEIAKLHGVQSPKEHFKAYSIKPHTGVPKPKLGKHQILNKEKDVFHPFQEFVKKNEAIRSVLPSSTSYEIFHPYKSEEPALKELYQNPVMEKIRNDIEQNKIRLQKHENEASQPDITKDEYLERPEETDRKKLPHKNVPAPYEIHRPERRPVYYNPPPIHNQREQVLNQKLKHPWHQGYVKIKPALYHPVKNHLQKLRQQHALKYDDERNEYPQLPIAEKDDDSSDGYDIYEKGKAKFVQLRNNVDESINEAVQKNRPKEHQKLELIEDDYDEDANTNNDDDEDNFVPVKNYAQVRKTETTKHLPKEAAYHDADTLEEIQNAPRLREAIKSSKAQTVYSEEGYEDSAYDHAGEQKHASDHEEHKGSLKENELSNGKFKSPTLNTKYQDDNGSEYRDQVLDGKKWKDTEKNTEKETELEEYSETERENSDESDTYTRKTKNNENYDNNDEDEGNYDSREDEIKRIKREPAYENQSTKKIEIDNSLNNSVRVNTEQAVNDRATEIKVPELKLNSPYLSEKQVIPLSTLNVLKKTDNINEKYPYYYNKVKGINKDSPLRYAENLKFIPNKSKGGTEFYDSRDKIQCPEVEDNIDPIPEKLKKGGHPDDKEEDEYDDDDDDDDEDNEERKNESESSEINQTPRLKGLGDKIDCFKAKYFGENPLDSPFFREEVISNPEPVIIPSIDIYRLKQAKQLTTQKSEVNDKQDLINTKHQPSNSSRSTNNEDTFVPLASSSELKSQVDSKVNQKITIQTPKHRKGKNVINSVRKKRAAPFVYEPYKIIRDSQIQDSKKTTTTNNISPLIKQLQSSRVADKVTTNTGKDQIVKRSTGSRPYKDIGKSERVKNIKSKGSQPIYDASFVDVSIDQRRGEPRYELRTSNHNNQYSPIENKRSSTIRTDTKSVDTQEDHSQSKRKPNRRRRTTTTRPYFDVSKFLPQEETDKTETITNQPTSSKLDKLVESSKEHHTEDDDSKRNVPQTMPLKTQSRRKIIDNLSTENPEVEVDSTLNDSPKLHLKTRFTNSDPTETSITQKRTQTPTHAYDDDEKIKAPKYREKKKKISKSTLVTDTNSYGEDDDDDLSKEEEVDALIGVKHDIEEYIPTYETETGKKDLPSVSSSDSQDDEEDYGSHGHNYGDDDDDDDENDDEEEDDDEDEDDEEEDEIEIEENIKSEATTPEPTKRTLIKTTEAPITTTEARSAKLEIEPVVVRKKLDIHKELPVNRSSPHVTEFKQDIEEVEIIKETPSRKKKIPQKHIEALELYKDENLAKDINKLGGVEVFKEGLDIINGPKHGGNYRIADDLTENNSQSSLSLRRKNENSSIGDVVASPSKTSKVIEVKSNPYSRRRIDIQRARNNRNKSAKLIELSDSTEKPTSRTMHGGNFKSIHDMRRRGGNRNSKLIELVDTGNRDDHSTTKHDGSSRSYGSRGGDRHQMHGGNYRSAKLVKADDKTSTQSKIETTTDGRQNSANLLNSFARAVSALSTTPTPYILDPSKRMYYYVEA